MKNVYRGLLAITACLLAGCAADRPIHYDAIQDLGYELGATYPASTEDVVEFVVQRSHYMNLGLQGLDRTLITLLEESDAWYQTVLYGYLLALRGEVNGFRAIMDHLGKWGLEPEAREGLQFCGLKYLGVVERAEPARVLGWEVSLSEWGDYLDYIEEFSLVNWRVHYLQEIVLSGRPSSGDEALAAAQWLSFTLRPADVSYLAGLLERGSPKCDLALLQILSTLLMRDFLAENEASPDLEESIKIFRAWHDGYASERPDEWITDAFSTAGYEVDDLFKQTSIARVTPALFDDSEQWVVVRSHALAALNRVCGFHVDRGVIFKPEELRQEVADAYLDWYKNLAGRVTSE
jgi:hypothetical protein